MKKLLTIILILSTSALFGQNISIGKEYGMKKTTGTASGKLGANYYDTSNITIDGDVLMSGCLHCKGTPAYFRIDSNGILIPFGKSSELGGGSMDTALYYYDTTLTNLKVPVNLPNTWPHGNLLYRQPEVTIDTIKVKALITTDKIKAPFEVELLWVRERDGFPMLAIYPPPVRLNKYLSFDKKELPKTTTVWISTPIN
jgi:hypothetical protein